MKPVLALAVLIASASPVLAQTAFCPYGQTCNGKPSVPFPVISPLQGLSNLLPQRQQQPPSPPVAYAPIPTPPPVMPATSP
jgi:hypothetical protein